MTSQRWIRLFCGVMVTATLMVERTLGQDAVKDTAPLDKEQIEAALKLTKDAAAKYEFSLDEAPRATVHLQAESLLRWSNPAAGEIHGKVFLWLVDGRPVVIGSLYKWFSPHTHLSHEFHSLAESPLRARYDENEVWTTTAPGLKFVPLPDSPAPATSAGQRLLQMRQFAKDFSATKHERDGSHSELRLLTQPIYRYATPGDGLIDGALFSFVQGTDPEVFLLLEARGDKDAPRWTFAATRMNSVGFQLRYHDKEVWSVEIMPWRDVTSHREVYTTFQFK